MQAANFGTKIKLRVALRSFEGICQMAGKGVGIGIVPESAAKRLKQSTQIVMTRLQDEWAVRQLSICVQSDAELTPPARNLFEHLLTSTAR
jgi:DNA-binding transcriptional LysR family regulator